MLSLTLAKMTPRDPLCHAENVTCRTFSRMSFGDAGRNGTSTDPR